MEKLNIQPKAFLWITRRASPLRLATRDQVLCRKLFFQETTTARIEWSLVWSTFRVFDPFRVVHGGMMPGHPNFNMPVWMSLVCRGFDRRECIHRLRSLLR